MKNKMMKEIIDEKYQSKDWKLLYLSRTSVLLIITIVLFTIYFYVKHLYFSSFLLPSSIIMIILISLNSNILKNG